MSEVFISYKSEDRERAQVLANSLEKCGFSVWWDVRIRPGHKWDDVIDEALTKSRCVLALFSTRSVSSDYVKNEASDARQRGILVPVLIDQVPMPLEFRRVQAANLVGWDGDIDHPEFAVLVESIREILGRVSAPAPSATTAAPRSVGVAPKTGRRKKVTAAAAVIASTVLLASMWLWRQSESNPPDAVQLRAAITGTRTGFLTYQGKPLRAFVIGLYVTNVTSGQLLLNSVALQVAGDSQWNDQCVLHPLETNEYTVQPFSAGIEPKKPRSFDVYFPTDKGVEAFKRFVLRVGFLDSAAARNSLDSVFTPNPTQ